MENYQNLINRYNAEKENNEVALNRCKKQIHLLGTLKLTVFVATIAIIMVLRKGEYLPVMATLLGGIIAYIALAVKQNNRFKLREYLQTAITVDCQEVEALHYNFNSFDDGKAFLTPTHPYANDIDLFGKNSLFQSINRTVTSGGSQVLAKWLMHPLNNIIDINKRQIAVGEMAKNWKWRRDFRIKGLLKVCKSEEAGEIKEWCDMEVAFSNRWAFRVLPYLVGACNIALLTTTLMGVVSPALWPFLFSAFVIMGMGFMSRISKLHSRYGRRMKMLDKYAQLIECVEQLNTQSEIIAALKMKLTADGVNASTVVGKLHKLMNTMDQRNNVMMLVILNGLFFWDLYNFMKLERWKIKYTRYLPNWIEAVDEVDALCSLANFAENHPDYIFPEAIDAPFVIEGSNLGHPLMRREKCVCNDIDIDKRPYFIIVTGANMAGKSTYLRTVCVNYVLGMVGAPVCATTFRFTPSQLITSLRTTDSLTDNESYFFAELKQLKEIIDRLISGERLFIVLDEILKGTNSVDKQAGSLALIKQLIALNANGIIATHDLVLGTLKDQYPENIENLCFEADITNNELTFTYKVRKGVAQNMNACFLMQKMGIAIADYKL